MRNSGNARGRAGYDARVEYWDQPVRRRSLFARLFRALVILGVVGVILGGIGAAAALYEIGRTPRELAPFIERRASKHNDIITETAAFVSSTLIAADRMNVTADLPIPSAFGASPDRSGPTPPGRLRLVASQDELMAAANEARPGDVIQIVPGKYTFAAWHTLVLSQPGTANAPIVLRAARLGDVTIETAMMEMFKVAAPFWHIENLIFRGVCVEHSDCEHAFHITGKGSDVVFRNDRFEDFNAHLKINGENGDWPDRGTVEGSTFLENTPRQTRNPITPIDLVGANAWHLRSNFIADFVPSDPSKATYGAFFKGAGEDNVMERNLVVCEWKLRGSLGAHIGLSLGGGGSDRALMRDVGRTGFEQIRGVLRDNLIVACNDDGIYLNASARSVVDHNTLIDTAGIDARFPQTSATITANVVDGTIRARDDARITGWDNDRPFLLKLFAGLHPQRDYFNDPSRLDLAWHDKPEPVPATDPRPDLCGRPRHDPAMPGAFEDFAACLGR